MRSEESLRRHRETDRLWYQNNKDTIKSQNSKRNARYYKEWIDWFKFLYGQNPTCSICNKKLLWKGGQGKSPHFDHRHGKTPIVNPAAWLRSRPLTENSKQEWLEEDFGILCSTCNTSLPTKNRNLWLSNAIKYLIDGGKHESNY